MISSVNIENGEVIRISSCDELFKIVELYKDKYYIKENYSFYYRGEKNSCWRLLPGLLRNCNCSNELEEISKNDKVKDDLEIDLALLQHYGASTRCIDFSKNIKVALYFATCDWDSPDCVDGSIYITNFLFHKPQWFTNYLVNYVAKFNDKSIIDWDFSQHFMNLSAIEKEFRRAGRPFDLYNVTTEIRYYLSQGFLVDFTYLNKYDKRITSQEAALFYYPSQFYYVDHESKKRFKCENNKVSLANYVSYEIDLHSLYDCNLNASALKIIIPKEIKKEIYEMININSKTLGLS